MSAGFRLRQYFLDGLHQLASRRRSQLYRDARARTLRFVDEIDVERVLFLDVIRMVERDVSSRSSNQPSFPLPLPSIGTCLAIIVHIVVLLLCSAKPFQQPRHSRMLLAGIKILSDWTPD